MAGAVVARAEGDSGILLRQLQKRGALSSTEGPSLYQAMRPDIRQW
jgi:hypothetical protein